MPVVLPDQMEAVLIGAAVLGACASQDYSTIQVEYTHSSSGRKGIWGDLFRVASNDQMYPCVHSTQVMVFN